VNKLSDVNVNYLKIPKRHRGPHKTPSRATCVPRVWNPGLTECPFKHIFLAKFSETHHVAKRRFTLREYVTVMKLAEAGYSAVAV